MIYVFNVLVSALVIGFVSWLSGRFPTTAGFIVALPLATMLVLPLSYQTHGDAAGVATMARSIFVAVPVTMTFFLPFLFSDRLNLSFWQAYALGCFALPIGYGIHRAITKLAFS